MAFRSSQFRARFARLAAVAAMVVAGLGMQAATPAPSVANGPYNIEGQTWLANSSGEVVRLSGAPNHGSLKGVPLNRPIVGMTPTRSGNGYWMVATDGGVFSFGDAAFYGSTGNIRLNQPIIAMAQTKSGDGYWLIASDGGIFSYGDARFYGSTGNIRLNKPIVAMTPTPSGNGYWLVASDGGVFSFGDAAFYGSTGNIRLIQPIVSMAPTPSGKGYWLAAADGGIFAFGDAGFFGSAGGSPTANFVQVVAKSDGRGYWLVRKGGDTLSYGTATSGSRPPVAQVFKPGNRGEIAVDYAIRRLGTPYVWGGNGPNGYDCSGLTSQAWKSAGSGIPRVANDQYNFGTRIPLDQLRPGDLLFWGPDRANSRSIDHVGMYVGGGWAINSSSGGVSMRSVPGTSGWMFPYGVRPAS